jgi:hypothetical protein
MVGLSVVAGMAITSAVPSVAWDSSMLPGWLSRNLSDVAEKSKEAAVPLQIRGGATAENEFAEAARRIFGNENHESLDEARRFLRSIPKDSPAYNDAQALLQASERSGDEGHGTDTGGNKPRLEILSSEQQGGRLKVTLRNNSDQPIRSVRYGVSYFRVIDGSQLDPGFQSVLTGEIRSGATKTFEVAPDDLGGQVYRSFALLGWEY